jgi:hypothetical protein
LAIYLSFGIFSILGRKNYDEESTRNDWHIETIPGLVYTL